MVNKVFDNYEELSHEAGLFLTQGVEQNPNISFCCPTGATPTGMYREFVKTVKEKNIDYSKLTIVKLDEWIGLEPTNESTCEYYLQQHLLQPLQIHESQYIGFQADAKDPQAECGRIDSLVHEKLGAIDICVLGLGLNGHLGMNEPGASEETHAHVATLTQETRSHSMLSGNTKPVTEGMTLGMQDILQSKMVLLLVNGESKKEQYKRLMQKDIAPDFPALYLWKHPNFWCFADKEAAN